MQFQVPQFIDIEDRIIGPFTLKQFLYVAAAGGLGFILFYINFYVFLMLTPIIGAIAGALAFWKVNGRDFLFFLNSLSNFFLKPRSYRWKRLARPEQSALSRKEERDTATRPSQTLHPEAKFNKLRHVAWQLDSMKRTK